jgi:hypothetical protein
MTCDKKGIAISAEADVNILDVHDVKFIAEADLKEEISLVPFYRPDIVSIIRPRLERLHINIDNYKLFEYSKFFPVKNLSVEI